MSLALKYRPAVFTDVAGQRPRAVVLYQMVRKGQLPSALLFHGASGCGKTTMARILGMALNCQAGPGPGSSWPCGTCPPCKSVIAGTSLDVIEIDAASHGSVDDIRDLRQRLLYGSGGEWRLVILDEAHGVSGPGFESLLTIMEEPPPGTVFVLLTTEPRKIPATIASRCVPLPFPSVPPAEVTARLGHICAAEGIEAEPALLALLTERSGGNMRSAVMLLEQASVTGIATAADWYRLHGETDFAPALLAAAADGDHAALFGQLDQVLAQTGDYPAITEKLACCLRDVLVLTAGGSVPATGQALAARQEMAARVSPGRAVAALKVLWDLQTKVRTEDRKAGLILALTRVGDALCPLPAEAAAVPARSLEQPVSVDSLRAMLGAT